MIKNKMSGMIGGSQGGLGSLMSMLG